MVILLHGDEPYKKECFKKKLIQEKEEFQIRTFYEWNSAALEAVENSNSLFGGRPLVLLLCEELNQDDSLLRYLESPNPETDLVMIPKKVDKRMNVFKTCEKCGFLKECNKLTQQEAMKYVHTIVKSYEADMSNEDILYFIQVSGYLTSKEVTLYELITYAKMLAFAADGMVVRREQINSLVKKTMETKMFALAELLSEKKEKELFSLAEALLREGENAIAMMALLQRAFRLSFKMQLFPEATEGELASMLGVPGFQLRSLPKNVSNVNEIVATFNSGILQVKKGVNERIAFITTLSKVLHLLD